MFAGPLLPHQVFVFGSNGQGFHGAGAAGLAMRGDSRNTWRQDQAFLDAMASQPGSPLRVGKWAVFGKARGPQKGTEGKSYAVQTVIRPGLRRSVPLEDIKAQLLQLKLFSESRPELEFLLTRLGEGYAGYTADEMDRVWDSLRPFPTNWSFLGRGSTPAEKELT